MRDAKEDIIIARDTDGRTTVYHHRLATATNKNRFPFWVSYDSVYRTGGGLTCGDLVGDGKDEMIAANAASGAVRAYEPTCGRRMVPHVKSGMANKDFVFYSDHANPTVWSNSMDMADFPLAFGSSNPFVFAAACLSGNYGSNGNYTLSEAFLDSGASLYLGATENSSPSPDRMLMEYLYKGLVNTTSSVGRAFTYAERMMIDKAKYYGAVREYNLYGDPKLGELPVAGAQGEMLYGGALLETPPAHHQVVVPDYVASQIGDWDLVDIPDGTVTQTAGEPRLPIYAAQLTYPAGYQVQEVVLTGRSEPIEVPGLHLPEPLLITKTLPPAWSEPQGVPEARWYPERDFEWYAAANGDGNTTLTLLLYPFHYNPATTDARFYQVWDFDIHAVTSPVTVTLEIANAAEPQDVVVEASILRYGSAEIVSGLLLRTLHGLEGSASFSPVWQSDPQPAGYYRGGRPAAARRHPAGARARPLSPGHRRARANGPGGHPQPL